MKENLLRMDLRDWFAGQALMSMLSAVQDITESTPSTAAKYSYKFADAMMVEREFKKIEPRGMNGGVDE